MTEAIFIWEFKTDDLNRADFLCMGTVAEANKLAALLANRDGNYKYHMECPEITNISKLLAEMGVSEVIADILTEMEISDAIANEF